MLYEVHVTVASRDTDRWIQVCGQLSIKPLLIQLSAGDYRHQLMCAAVHDGDDLSAARYVDELTRQILSAGYIILRVKLERPLSDIDDDAQLAYAECHIKLRVDESLEPTILAAAGLGLHLSRSLLGVTRPMAKWYLTQRTYGIPASAAAIIFQQAFTAVIQLIPAAKMETEAVVYDTNPAIDRGWTHH